MAEVIVLPGVERPSLGAVHCLSTEKVCAAAIDAGVTDVVLVGRDRDGSLYVAAGNGDAEKMAGMLMRAVHMLTSDDWTPADFDTDDEA